MKATMKIAVGTDFSAEGDVAVRQAVEIARHLGGEVVLVHVARGDELQALGRRTDLSLHAAAKPDRATLARPSDLARQHLAALGDRLSGQGPVVSQVLTEGLPDVGLCEAAADMGARLVVVGTHGHTGLRWFLLGSVAQHVVRDAPADVLVARRAEAGRGGYRRILVATDFSPSAERALDRAMELAGPGAAIDVVHFLHIAVSVGADAAVPDWSGLEATLAAELQAQGEALVAARRRPDGPALRFLVRHIAAVPGVVHALEQEPYDLVALGTHGRRGLPRALLGSVAEAVARRAPCSVLIARP